LLKHLLVHFRNAPHKHNFTSDALNNRVATVASWNVLSLRQGLTELPCEGGGSSIVVSCTALPVSLLFYHTTYSQESATCPFPESDQSSQRPSNRFL